MIAIAITLRPIPEPNPILALLDNSLGVLTGEVCTEFENVLGAKLGIVRNLEDVVRSKLGVSIFVYSYMKAFD